MKNGYRVYVVMVALAWFGCGLPGGAAEAASPGEQAFVKNCAVCHPKGGNIINPAMGLDKRALTDNGIRDVAGIVETMRKPGPGMSPFDEKAIPDGTAKAIAEYILSTFK